MSTPQEEQWPSHPEVDQQQPETFNEHCTIFKMSPPGPFPRRHVECLHCGAFFPLQDLLEGELNDDQCPVCGTWAAQYYARKKTGE